ncbi:hypothetical protein WAE56_18090 [Iodobacter sp. LRB]|uniref:hypothetical protein n=1 Tax=unclassified Iodobacter TaxID=235634 RepID=UPI00117B314E|nr:hypothetical protein [Iodobacter sp. BJB302]
MRVFFPILLCAALLPFSAQAEDAPLPFDVPSAAPAIQRVPVANKTVVHSPAAQPAVKPGRHKHAAARKNKKTQSGVTKKHKGKQQTATSTRQKNKKARVVTHKKGAGVQHAKKVSGAKPKSAHKQPAHKKAAHKKRAGH